MVSNRASPLHAQALAALRAARGQNPAATLGRHAGTETVGLRPLASIRLIGALHVLFPSVVQSNFESISHVPSESRKIPKNAKNLGIRGREEGCKLRGSGGTGRGWHGTGAHDGPKGIGGGGGEQARRGGGRREGAQRGAVDSHGDQSRFAGASRQRRDAEGGAKKGGQRGSWSGRWVGSQEDWIGPRETGVPFRLGRH